MSKTQQRIIAKAVKDNQPAVRAKPKSDQELFRKGSFLVKQFKNLQGRLLMQGGQSTELALSALKWGEPVPKNATAAHRLAKKGEKMLEKYNKLKEIKERNER